MGEVNLAQGRGFYPGSAPLEGGKYLCPASSLLLGVDIDYKVSISLTRDSATMGLEGYLKLVRLGDLRSRNPLIKAAGSLDLLAMPSYT